MQQGFRNKFNNLRLNRMPEAEPDKMPDQPQNIVAINVEHNKETDPQNDTDNSITATNIQFEQDDHANTNQSSCNKVLLSSSSSEIPIIKSRPTELFTDRLYFSDSDDTNCSIITNDNDNEDNGLQNSSDIPETETQMKMLQITAVETEQCLESEQLFSSNRTSSELSLPPATQKYNPCVNRLSQQLDNLSLIHEEQVAPIINNLTATTIPKNSEDDFQFSEDDNQIVVANPTIVDKSLMLSGTTVPNDSVINRMLNENDTMKPNESFHETIISVDSSTSEESDGEADEDEDEDDSDDGTEIIAVISITDSDEENENECEPNQAIPQKPPEYHPPVSSSLSSTVVQKLDEFFNNIPLIDSPNTSATEQNENAQNNDESICVSETPEPSLNNSKNSHHSNDMEIEKSADDLYVSATPEPSEDNSIATSNEADDNQNAENEKSITQTPNKDAKLQLEPSKSNEIKISTPNGKLKGTPTINISAKINIQIHLPEDGSSASESISSKSSGNTSSLSADTSRPPSTEITPEKSQLLKTPEPLITERQTRSSTKKLLGASGGNKTPITPENQKSNRMDISPSPKRTLFKTPMIDDKATKLMPKPRRSEIDSDAQAILNALYGKAWQTPELLRKCSSKTGDKERNVAERQRPVTEVKQKAQKPKQRDSFANDFCHFRKNAPTDLESTRIGTLAQNIQPKEKIMENPIVLSPHFKKPDDLLPVANDSDDFQIKRSNKKKPAAYKIIDDDLSESNSDVSDFDNDSDDSSYSSKNKSVICDSTYSSSESEKENNRTRRQVKKKSTKVVKGKKEKSFADKLVYLDLTNVEADIDPDHDSPNATESELVQITQKLFDIDTLLGSCEFKKKSYQPNAVQSKEECTPQPQQKTKRKLFTPSHYNDRDDDDVDNAKNSNEISSEVSESETNVNPKLLIPINRHLESIKRSEFPRPKFDLKPSALLQSPTTQKSSLPLPKTPVQTPKTPSLPNGTNSNNKKLPTIGRDSFFSTHKTFGFLHSLDDRILKEYCHPDALRYRNNFKTNRDELTDYLYNLYNSKVFDNKLRAPVFWNKKLLKTAGRCISRKRQGVLSCTIELSDKVVTSADRLRCTLIHEMCHAAAWLFDEVTGHGVKWRNWAQRANNVFEELPTIKVCHQYDIQYKYVYKCTLCNAKSNSHTKSRKVELIRCAYCHGPIEILLNKKDKDGQTIQTPVPVREASGFAKFVKEKYKDFRLPGVKHAEVMKLLSNAFAELKCANK